MAGSKNHTNSLKTRAGRCGFSSTFAGRRPQMTDPKLWLLYGFAVSSAGRKGDALSVMDHAYQVYVAAGEPEELRSGFAGIR
jgi:hypothetical protein